MTLDHCMKPFNSKFDNRIESGKRIIVSAMVLITMIPLLGCHKVNVSGIRNRLTPSNDRDWKPELATVPFADVDGSQFTIRNIRNCNYVTAEDYVVDYYDRQILIDQIQSVDFIVVPFKNAPRLAHTMMSFGIDDGSYLAVSVEVRNERGEKYNPLLGIGRKFELMYPTVASAEQAQNLFADIIQRVNKLAVEPEFYNSVTNNCTTNLAGHVNELSPNKIRFGWKVLLPGLSAQYAYDLGLLDNRIPFEDLTSIALVNRLADEHFEDPQFSKLIRSRRKRIERHLALQEKREPTLSGRGSQYLEAQRRPRVLHRR